MSYVKPCLTLPSHVVNKTVLRAKTYVLVFGSFIKGIHMNLTSLGGFLQSSRRSFRHSRIIVRTPRKTHTQTKPTTAPSNSPQLTKNSPQLPQNAPELRDNFPNLRETFPNRWENLPNLRETHTQNLKQDLAIFATSGRVCPTSGQTFLQLPENSPDSRKTSGMTAAVTSLVIMTGSLVIMTGSLKHDG